MASRQEKLATAAEANAFPVYAIPMDETARTIWETIVRGKNIHRITDPESPDLVAFYDFIKDRFPPEEMEPFSRFKDEIKHSDPSTLEAQCFVAKDPKSGKVVSCSYSTVLEGDMIAWRFMVTDSDYQRTRVSSELVIRAFENASRVAREQDKEIRYQLGETEAGHIEQFLNTLLKRKRVYTKREDGVWQEMHYELPHLGDWDSKTGKPIQPADKVALLHPMVREKGTDDVTFGGLTEMLEKMWKYWYLRSPDSFEGGKQGAAYKNHERVIMEMLRNKILNPLQGKELRCFASHEREQLSREGVIFSHFDDAPPGT